MRFGQPAEHGACFKPLGADSIPVAPTEPRIRLASSARAALGAPGIATTNRPDCERERHCQLTSSVRGRLPVDDRGMIRSRSTRLRRRRRGTTGTKQHSASLRERSRPYGRQHPATERPTRCSRRPERVAPRTTDIGLPKAHHRRRRRMPPEPPEESRATSPHRSSGDCASPPPPPSRGRRPEVPDRSGVQCPPTWLADVNRVDPGTLPRGGLTRRHYHSTSERSSVAQRLSRVAVAVVHGRRPPCLRHKCHRGQFARMSQCISFPLHRGRVSPRVTGDVIGRVAGTHPTAMSPETQHCRTVPRRTVSGVTVEPAYMSE